MKVTSVFDFGDDLCISPEIKTNLNLSFTLGDVMLMPDIRETIINGLIPLLRRFHMPEKEIRDWTNSIRYSQKLYQNLPYPYFMRAGSYFIGNHVDKKARYTIQDLLEGKVPDISVESLNLG